uniref:Profilin n=1 Tax=Blastobotrys adeninivorans TaxID=409370 RepID=A0A060T3S8_BLAAD
MSWQAYVDNLLGSGSVDQAALYSRAGDSVWAKSANFEVSAPEINEIAKGFDDSSQLQASGLHVQGQKYFMLRADDRSIYGKLNDTGIVAVRTKQALLIAHYSAPTQPGEATKVVEQLADYLISVGY